jgi:hypothetical protein
MDKAIVISPGWNEQIERGIITRTGASPAEIHYRYTARLRRIVYHSLRLETSEIAKFAGITKIAGIKSE